MYIILPVACVICFLWVLYEYYKARYQAPHKGYSDRIALSGIVCGILIFFLFAKHDVIAEEWRSKVIANYKSELVTAYVGTPDYSKGYHYTSTDKHEALKAATIEWTLFLIMFAFPIIMLLKYSEIKKLDDWEIEYISDHNERRKVERQRREWYEKHPHRVKPRKPL